MNLPEFQRILARIVTSPDLRERFLGDPEGVGDSLGWDIGLTRSTGDDPRSSATSLRGESDQQTMSRGLRVAPSDVQSTGRLSVLHPLP